MNELRTLTYYQFENSGPATTNEVDLVNVLGPLEDICWDHNCKYEGSRIMSEYQAFLPTKVKSAFSLGKTRIYNAYVSAKGKDGLITIVEARNGVVNNDLIKALEKAYGHPPSVRRVAIQII